MLQQLITHCAWWLTPLQFPKGRSDALTSHLLRKCPNVTQEDRQWVFDQIQQNPERPRSKTSQPVKGLSPNITQDDLQSEIQVPNFQQQSALDTLAEVSRRHLDYSSQRDFVGAFQDPKTSEAINEQALIAQLRESAGLNHPVTSTEPTGLYLYATADLEPQQAQQPLEIPIVTTSALAISPLVQAASAANQQLEQAQTESTGFAQNGSIVDPQLRDMGAPLHPQLNGSDKVDNEIDVMTWNPTNALGPQQTLGSLSMPSNGPTSGFGVLQKPTKQKTRSHFNDTRRKEVQEIRKQGACIRCRMLKKPCSGETPCSTCRNVESARLWKGTCLRTRLWEEFSLWSAKLFYSRAEIEIPASVQGLEQHLQPGRIEARLFPGSAICVSFAALAYAPMGINPNFRGDGTTDSTSVDTIWLLGERDTIPDKLEAYTNQIADDFIDAEPSLFMRTTLQRAQHLIREEEAEQASKAAGEHDQKSPRSSYTLLNQLLKSVIDLWVQTRLLASHDEHVVQLHYDPNTRPRLQPDTAVSEGEHRNSFSNDISGASDSYRLIKAQLMAGLESNCSKLSKTVINELERRLLRRQQVSRFATFLSAVILLNSVERITGFYRSMDTEGQQTAPSYLGHPTADSGADPLENNHRAMEAAWGNMSYRVTDHPNFWPLDIPPSALWPQGPHFSKLLNMLLRVRALPPKTSQTPDGTLVAMQDFSLPVHVNGRPVREQVDEQTKTAAAWLDPLKLSVSELVHKRDGALPGRNDGVEEWDMRFVAKVLLPERMR